MGISDLLRKQATAQLHPTWAAAYPSLARNGLHAFTDYDPESDSQGPFAGAVKMDTGHILHLGCSDREDGTPAKWGLSITHRDDYGPEGWGFPARKVAVSLGEGDHDVGDRVVRALRHPEVMEGMRRLMQPPAPGEWWHHEVKVR